jgi:hypothetical protein
MTPARGRLFVSAVDPEETLPGGRIALPALVREQFAMNQRVVKDVGLPMRCDDPECARTHGLDDQQRVVHPVAVEPGDWVVLRPRSVQETHDRGIQCCHQDDVLAVLTVTP